MHSQLLVDRPNDLPFLEVTRPDSGEVGWWRGTKDDEALVGQFVDSLWGGADAWEVTGWSMVAVSGTGHSRRSTWRVECRSASHGAITYIVDVHPAPPAVAVIRDAMAELGLEPGARPSTLEHLLWNAFLTIADDVAVELPDGAGVALEVDHEVWGPWVPDCEGWFRDETDVSPFVIYLRWYLSPLSDDTAAQLGLVESLQAAFSDLADRAPIVVHHSIPTADRANGHLAALSDGLARLERDGWTVVADCAESPAMCSEDPPIRVELEAWLWLQPHTEVDTDDAAAPQEADDLELDGDDMADDKIGDDEGGDGTSESDDEDGDAHVGYEVVVPFDRATLDAIEALMVAGATPDAAVLEVTGSITLPRAD